MVGQYLPQTNEKCYNILQWLMRFFLFLFTSSKHSACRPDLSEPPLSLFMKGGGVSWDAADMWARSASRHHFTLPPPTSAQCLPHSPHHGWGRARINRPDPWCYSIAPLPPLELGVSLPLLRPPLVLASSRLQCSAFLSWLLARRSGT